MSEGLFSVVKQFCARLSRQVKEQFSSTVQIGEHLSTRPVGKTRVVHSICHHGNHTPSANHSPMASKLKKRESHVGNKADRVAVGRQYAFPAFITITLRSSCPRFHPLSYTLNHIPKRLTRTSERRPVCKGHTQCDNLYRQLAHPDDFMSFLIGFHSHCLLCFRFVKFFTCLTISPLVIIFHSNR